MYRVNGSLCKPVVSRDELNIGKFFGNRINLLPSDSLILMPKVSMAKMPEDRSKRRLLLLLHASLVLTIPIFMVVGYLLKRQLLPLLGGGQDG